MIQRNPALAVGLLMGLSQTLPAYADYFRASQTCPATASIHNPRMDGVQVEPGQTYPAGNLNKPNGDYLQVKIPSANPPQRWVKLSCGDRTDNPGPDQGGGTQPPNNGGGATTPAGGSSRSGEFLLAASWQAAFCESSAGQNKSECASQTSSRFDGSHFTLHGLWPQPRGNDYCKVPPRQKQDDEKHRWDDLPETPLSAATRSALGEVMPGLQSNLDRHEWTKHGTCFGTGPESYFRTAIALMGQLNTSKLQALVAQNIGQPVSAQALRDAFEETFGQGSASALSIECSKDGPRTLISGISVHLKGSLSESTPIKSVLDTAAGGKAECQSGVVDSVGLN
jgi:ribonuclease T2